MKRIQNSLAPWPRLRDTLLLCALARAYAPKRDASSSLSAITTPCVHSSRSMTLQVQLSNHTRLPVASHALPVHVALKRRALRGRSTCSSAPPSSSQPRTPEAASPPQPPFVLFSVHLQVDRFPISPFNAVEHSHEACAHTLIVLWLGAPSNINIRKWLAVAYRRLGSHIITPVGPAYGVLVRQYRRAELGRR